MFEKGEIGKAQTISPIREKWGKMKKNVVFHNKSTGPAEYCKNMKKIYSHA